MGRLKMFKAHSILVEYNEKLCRINCIEKIGRNLFAVISLDTLYRYDLEKEIHPKENIHYQQVNIYFEQVEEEIKNPFLKWFPSLEDAVDDFLSGEW